MRSKSGSHYALTYAIGMFLMFHCSIGSQGATDCESFNFSVTADDYMVLYVDEKLVAKAGVGSLGIVELNCSTQVIAILAVNTVQYAGIRGSDEIDYLLTNNTWKCTSTTYYGWTTAEFDDSNWPSAVVSSKNDTNYVEGIRNESQWIWTEDYYDDFSPVYCRKTLHQPTDIVSGVSVVPTYGPMAGGTLLSIMVNWTIEHHYVRTVYIGQNLRATYVNRTGQYVYVKTPSISNSSLINQPLPILLETSPNSVNVSTGKYFTYKPNPVVYDVIPKALSISGGIRLNISGKNLDSVYQPFTRALVNVWNATNNTYSNESFAPCYPPTQNGTQMICLSPTIYIRDDFLRLLYHQTDPYSNSYNRRKRQAMMSNAWQREEEGQSLLSISSSMYKSRSKREMDFAATNQSYTQKDNQDTLKIYLGIVFDGYERYKNNLLMDNGGHFSLFYPPSISCQDDLKFDPDKKDTITIQGANMEQCCREVDYTVRIGNGTCNIKSLTDNALICSPPKVKPQQTENDTLYCGENFAIIVELGRKTYKCSCFMYSDDGTTTVIIITTVTIGLFFLLLILVIVILILIRKYRSQKSPQMNIPQQVNNKQANTENDGPVFNRNKRETLDYAPTIDYTREFPGDDRTRKSLRGLSGYLQPAENEYRNSGETVYNRIIEE